MTKPIYTLDMVRGIGSDTVFISDISYIHYRQWLKLESLEFSNTYVFKGESAIVRVYDCYESVGREAALKCATSWLRGETTTYKLD